MNSYIKKIGVYLPGEPVNNDNFVKRYKNIELNASMINMLFGAKHRHLAPSETQCSDLATNAALKIVTQEEKKEIDFLIFATASADLIEPATANIVQYKLGLTCPSIDVKNACNSFISALEIADAYISQGKYKNILIVSGEKTSDSIHFDAKDKEELKNNLAATSFGDGGSAVWVSETSTPQSIVFSKFDTMGEYWDLSTIKGGGSMHPFDSSKNYFQGETSKLIHMLNDTRARGFVAQCFDDCPWDKSEVDVLITHQVATHFYKNLAESIDFPFEKIYQTFHLFGNTAASSIPIALNDAITLGKIKKGDKVMLLGVAAGISLGVICFTF